MRRLIFLALLLAGAARFSYAQSGKETPLLEDDLRANRRTKIDGAKDAIDSDLDAAFGKTSFSTRELERINDELRRALERERPRATPKLILFLYPGRVNMERLRILKDVYVDIEVIIDPCERTVCRDAVARHIELVGAAVRNAVLPTPNYKFEFKNVTIKTVTPALTGAIEAYRLPIGACITAAGRRGGGRAWLDNQQHQQDDFVPLVTRAIAQKAAARRVSLVGPPSVSRSGNSVDVRLHIRGDRNRLQQQVIDALSAEAAGLRENPTSPSDAHLEVVAEVQMQRFEQRQFRSPGQPVGLFLDGRLDPSALWSSYVEEVRKDKNAQRFAFDDDRKGDGAVDPLAGEADDNQMLAVLGANFKLLASCVQAEAAKNPKFRGLTFGFRWLPSGRAEAVAVKEASLKGSALERCLASAMANISLPRFAGSPRTIEYPIRVK